MFLLSGSAGACVLPPDNNLANQSAGNFGADASPLTANGLIKFTKTAAPVPPAANADAIFSGAAQTQPKWLGANANLEQKAVSPLQLKEDSDLVEPPQEDSGLTKDFSVSEPAASSSGPATTEAPMPRAGWIGLAGVLGVMAARWISAKRRARAKSAIG